MRTCPAARRTLRSLDLDRMTALALDLVDVGPVGPEPEPALAVGLTDAGDHPALLLRPLDGHPGDELPGFSAPSSWWAFGLVVTGTAHVWPVSAHSADRHARHDGAPRVRGAHLVARSGARVDVLQHGGDRPAVTGSSAPGDPATLAGRLPDLCRRVLGLATAPPEHGTGALWTSVWLDHLVERALGADAGSLDWVDLVACHPVVDVLADLEGAAALEPSPLDEIADELTGLGHVLADAWDWAALRRACAEGTGPVFGLPPEIAAWMDDGIFSRSVLDSFPPRTELRAVLEHHLAPSLLRRIDAVVTAHDR